MPAEEMQAFVHQHLLSMLSPFSLHLKDLKDELQANLIMFASVQALAFGI